MNGRYGTAELKSILRKGEGEFNDRWALKTLWHIVASKLCVFVVSKGKKWRVLLPFTFAMWGNYFLMGGGVLLCDR